MTSVEEQAVVDSLVPQVLFQPSLIPLTLTIFLGQKNPICQLLNLDLGGFWGSIHKFSAKSVGEMALFENTCFCLIK